LIPKAFSTLKFSPQDVESIQFIADKNIIHILNAKVTVTGKKIRAKTFVNENFSCKDQKLKNLKTYHNTNNGENININHKINHLITNTIAKANRGNIKIILIKSLTIKIIDSFPGQTHQPTIKSLRE
jgi:hypothetical protein